MRSHGWPDEAGRASYLAAFHGAQAAIFEEAGKLVKTHQGVHMEFARIVREVPEFHAKVWLFLHRGYTLKSLADYGTDPGMTITDEEAAAAIRSARLFIENIGAFLTRNT